MDVANPGLHTLQRITADGGHRALHGAAATRQIERRAAAALPPHTLMARAGLATARLAIALAPHARRVRVWCGPGNNGGDGLVAARHLQAMGRQVEVVLLGDATRLPADAAWALADARGAGVVIAAAASAEPADVVIDAVLGIGASRAPEGAIRDAIAAIDRAGDDVPVLAVDIPSGLHPDRGTRLGDAAVRASATLHCLTLKPGCFTAAGRDHAGAAWLDTLGATVHEPPTAWLHAGAQTQVRRHDSHKGSYGDVAVVGGASGMTGAAWLAARAALAAGAGRVYTSLLDDTAALLDPAQPELMGRRHWWRSPPEVLAEATVVCGCGGGDAVAAVLPPLLAHAGRLVLDADALNAVAGDATLGSALQRRSARGLPTVLTPHPLEAARLLGRDTAAVQADRLDAATALAERHGCAVVLKGSGSVVAAPGATPRLIASGNAALATAGTGDVLAGWTAGRWSCAMPSPALDVAADAAWQHGHAADAWPPAAAGAPLTATTLIQRLHLRAT